jgi:signal transduction histidine kinase
MRILVVVDHEVVRKGVVSLLVKQPDFSTQLMQTQDQERQRIARELHDSAGQLVTALGIALGNIAEHKHGDIRLTKNVEDGQDLVQQLSQEIRIMSYLLHPPLLDDNGLSDAVRWYIEGLKERRGLDIQLSVSEDFGRLPQEIELALFRIVQECLTNVHRHSESKSAIICVSGIHDNIALGVEDNGKGNGRDQWIPLRCRNNRNA